MTVILACASDGKVYMAADSQYSAGWSMKGTTRERKVIVAGDMLMGVSGDMRVLNLMRHQFQPPDRVEGREDDSYVISDVMRAVQTLMKDNEANFGDSEMLIGYRGRLFHVGSAYDCHELDGDLTAIGCGEGYAIGAMRALDKALPIQERMLRAVEIAGECASGIGPPYYVETLEGIMP